MVSVILKVLYFIAASFLFFSFFSSEPFSRIIGFGALALASLLSLIWDYLQNNK